MKNIKRTVSRKLEPEKKKVEPKPKKMEIDTNQDIFDSTMPPAFGSPRFKAVVSKKKKLNQINDQEEKLMDEIIKKKSTEGNYKNYIKLLNDKKKIIESYFAKPPLPPPKFKDK